MLQRTLDGGFVPIGAHCDDIVTMSDGTTRRREDALADCRGGLHSNEDDIREANHDIVTEILDAVNKRACDYAEHDDFGANYACCVRENHTEWADAIGEWLDMRCTDDDDLPGARPLYNGKVRDRLVKGIAQLVYDYDDFECFYQPNEYAHYYGEGCAIYSFDVGECEEQLSVSDFAEFEALAATGDLEDCLDDYSGDLYLSCNDHYDNAAEKRVRLGYVSNSGMFYGYTNPGGRWHYAVSDESMNEYLVSSIVAICESEA